MIVIDYETRSRADLPTVGAYNYARDPSTDILCLAMYDLDTDESIVFDPAERDMPDEWIIKLTNTDKVAAVNATFDRLIHEHCGIGWGFPKIDFNRWYCASAQFRVNALPANLEDAAKAAKVADLKDSRGKELIKLLSIPREDGTFNEDPQLMQEMMDYCMKDVLATVAVMRACRLMTPTEHEDWLLCERMNEKGVRIDHQLATYATQYADAEQADIAGQIAKVTQGVVTKPTQHQRIKKYVLDAIDGSTDENDVHLRKLMTVYKKGEKKVSLDKDVRESILTAVDEGGLHLFEDIEELIRLLDAASASSVAKFRKMLELADPVDHRVRGAFIHAGASQTHRFSSKGLQLHNMKRKCFTANETEDILAQMSSGREIPDVMQTLSKLLRPALRPKGRHAFVVGDWSGVETRGLPWISGDARAQNKLNLFRQGVDTYVEAAKGIFGKEDITPDDRQVGKIAELSLGYGGAAGAFSAMAKGYGLMLPEHMIKRTVKNWRRANPWAVEFWAALENAAKRAIRKKGSESFKAGLVTYHYVPQMLGGTLLCELPDGTCIQYPFARIEHSDRGDQIVAMKASIKPKKDEKRRHWGEVRLWGGLLSENVTQAICAALLRSCIREMGDMRKYLVAHVHDEVILEVPAHEVEQVAKDLKTLMETPPAFAEGFPLAAEPVILDRYGNH